MKKILIITDISLSDKYNAGNKNVLLSLCNFLNLEPGYKLDILSFSHQKPSENININIIHYPDYISLLFRKLLKKVKVDSKLIDYKKSYFREFILNFVLNRNNYDVVIIQYLENHHLIDICKKHQCLTICDLHDIMTLRKESFIESGEKPYSENLNITLDEELNVINKFNAIIAIENSEKLFLEKNNVISKIILCKRGLPSFEKKIIVTPSLKIMNIGFIGSSAEFNFITVNYFINEIWNKGLFLNNYCLVIAGSVCKRLIGEKVLIKGNFKVLGLVDNVLDFYSSIHVSINPVFSGSGFKTKNAESLSYGVPIITSLNGIKGLEDVDNKYYNIILLEDSFNKWKDILETFHFNYDSEFKKTCSENFFLKFNEDNTFRQIKEYLL